MTEHLGWTLIHFLWQGALIAALYAIACQLLAHSSPARKYTLACAALATMMVAPLLTFFVTLSPNQAAAASHIAHRTAEASSVVEPLTFSVRGATSATLSERLLPWIVLLWFAGASTFSLCLIAGWTLAARMKSTRVRPVHPEWQNTLDRLRARIGLARPVKLLISALVQVPTIVGWLRPVVLVPAGALTGMPPDYIEALLIHELAHIRRQDYLINVLQSAAEALLFYHPAVWWVSGHIRAEREQCCDDTAISVSGDALTYAHALADLESSRPEHFTPAIAANDGSLTTRIARLLGKPQPASRTGSGIVVIASALVLIVTASGIFGQSPAPAFEVASIKRDVSGEAGGMFTLVPACHLERMTLKALVTFAYRVHDFQVTGGPGWVDSDRYNIDAKSEGTPSFNQEYVTVQSRRLQTLLRDRFNLTIHRETKELPVYGLTVAKRGPMLQTPNCLRREPGDFTIAPGKYCGLIGGSMASGRLQASSTTMANMARFLSSMLNRTVVDKTGITGEFDLQLTFTPDRPTVPSPGAARPHPADAAGAADLGPDFFTAIQEQLGLQLKPDKGPVEFLIIDHVDKPTGN